MRGLQGVLRPGMLRPDMRGRCPEARSEGLQGARVVGAAVCPACCSWGPLASLRGPVSVEEDAGGGGKDLSVPGGVFQAVWYSASTQCGPSPSAEASAWLPARNYCCQCEPAPPFQATPASR